MTGGAQRRVWVLTDERPGNRTQSMGVAQKLPYEFEEKHLEFSLLGGLPNRLMGGSHFRLRRRSRAILNAPWPDIAIAAGRKLAPALRYIKQKNPNCFTVYLMNPQTSLRHFDMVAMPEHDRPPTRPNVLPTVGPVHSLTTKKLTAEADKWRSQLAHLPEPRIALLVGGDSKSAQFSSHDFHDMGEMASNMARDIGEKDKPGSLMVTTSPRTNARAMDYLRLSLSVEHELFVWQSRVDNPYHAYLALANVIIVSGDSMSMCAEACALGKPVFIYVPRGGKLSPKLMRFHQSLFDRNLAQPLTAGAMPQWNTGAALDEAGRVASEIVRRNGTLI
ncbi:MAG: mitochondrial fission ELM1 family protein [Rickettsiales bacterium]|nr:mitochondrial fission ELM1 family protein [Rickettsiales bacterium]